MFKKTKRFLSCALAACSIVACAGTLTACETNKPEVKMTIEFNGEKYVLEYQLNRKITPNTVKHFLWLAEGGYYDNTVIHDYDADALHMYGGLYEYNSNGTGTDYVVDKSYKAFCDKYASSFPASVFTDEGETPTYTVYGEFSNNGFKVKSGALKEEFGSLVMYYSPKDTENRVYVKRADGDGYSDRVYEKNSATSEFYISMVSTARLQNDYCVFAQLTADGKEELTELQKAINTYIEDECEDKAENFVTSTSKDINNEDLFVSNQDQRVVFDIPNVPIIIKSVKVNKY